MCLRNTNETIKDLRELADLIESLHGKYDSADDEYYNKNIEDLICRTVGSMLGVVVFKIETPGVEGLYDRVRKGIPYKDMLAVDWDAWVHSTVLDTDQED